MGLSHIEAVLFDVGGTLFEPTTPFEQLWASELRGRGFVIDPAGLLRALSAQVEASVGMSPQVIRNLPRYEATWLEICRRTLETIGFAGDIRETAQALWRALVVGKVRPYADVVQTLEALRASGLQLAAVANWNVALEPALRGHHLADFFDAIVPSEFVGVEKPQPGIFQHALGALGVSADRAVHIGDSYEQDVVGAQAAGITAILLVREGPAVRDDVLTISSLGEVVALLES